MKIYWLLVTLLLLVGCTSSELKDAQTGIDDGFKTITIEDSVVIKVIPQENDGDVLKGCSWNLQTFGMKKAKDDYVMGEYNKTLSRLGCDFIVVQEIRDVDAVKSFGRFCNMFSGFTCLMSSRAGRSSSKEQFGVLYNSNLKVNGVRDFNPDPTDRWERPPFLINFTTGNYSFSVVIVHVKPDKVETKKEIKALEDEFGVFTDKVVIIGDMNAGCSYLSYSDEKELFKDWTWFIPFEADTTSGNSKCGFDRVVVNQVFKKSVSAVGVWIWDVPLNVSDHYPIWVQIKRGVV